MPPLVWPMDKTVKNFLTNDQYGGPELTMGSITPEMVVLSGYGKQTEQASKENSYMVSASTYCF